MELKVAQKVIMTRQIFRIYDQIPGNRMNGIKSIGFNLQDGSDYEGMFDIYVGGEVKK